jgi:hypothetical protein
MFPLIAMIMMNVPLIFAIRALAFVSTTSLIVHMKIHATFPTAIRLMVNACGRRYWTRINAKHVKFSRTTIKRVMTEITHVLDGSVKRIRLPIMQLVFIST